MQTEVEALQGFLAPEPGAAAARGRPGWAEPAWAEPAWAEPAWALRGGG